MGFAQPRRFKLQALSHNRRVEERERGCSGRPDLIVVENEFHLLSHSKFIAFVRWERVREKKQFIIIWLVIWMSAGMTWNPLQRDPVAVTQISSQTRTDTPRDRSLHLNCPLQGSAGGSVRRGPNRPQRPRRTIPIWIHLATGGMLISRGLAGHLDEEIWCCETRKPFKLSKSSGTACVSRLIVVSWFRELSSSVFQILPNIVFLAWIKHPCLLRLATVDANVTFKN